MHWVCRPPLLWSGFPACAPTAAAHLRKPTSQRNSTEGSLSEPSTSCKRVSPYGCWCARPRHRRANALVSRAALQSLCKVPNDGAAQRRRVIQNKVCEAQSNGWRANMLCVAMLRYKRGVSPPLWCHTCKMLVEDTWTTTGQVQSRQTMASGHSLTRCDPST